MNSKPSNRTNYLQGSCNQCSKIALLKYRGGTCSIQCFRANQSDYFQKEKRVLDAIRMNDLENDVIDYLHKFYKPYNRWYR